MSTLVKEKKFRCFEDCRQSGCPTHLMRVEIQTTSEVLMVYIDDKKVFGADPNIFSTLIAILAGFDYTFFDPTDFDPIEK